MPEISFLIDELNYELLKKARASFSRRAIHNLSEAEVIAAFSKILAIEDAYDDEMDRDLKEEIGWYDEDCHEPGSRFQKFLEEEE